MKRDTATQLEILGVGPVKILKMKKGARERAPDQEDGKKLRDS